MQAKEVPAVCVEADFGGSSHGAQLQTVFRDGLFRILALTPEVFAYVREPLDAEGKRILVLANRTEKREFSLPKGAKSLETGRFCGGKQTLDAWTARYYTVPANVEITAESLGIE